MAKKPVTTECPDHKFVFFTKDRMRIKNMLGLETPSDKLEIWRCPACGEVKIYFQKVT